MPLNRKGVSMNSLINRADDKVIKSLGDVMQIAFVPRDVEAALTFWTATMGVGPFFNLAHAQEQLQEHQFRGQACKADYSIWLSYWGDLQIEIIGQHNDAPSVYKEWQDAGNAGMHHVCIMVSDLDGALDRCARMGALPLQGGRSGESRYAYVDTAGGPGTMLEILQPAPEVRAYQEHMKQAAAAWDGRHPVRQFGA